MAIQLWDTATGQEQRPFAGHCSSVTCLDFAPDGRTLVSGTVDGTLRLWETATGKELRVFRGSKTFLRVVAFSPDGKTIASGDSENVVRLWEAATGADRGCFRGPPSKNEPYFEGVQSLAFAPDGLSLAFGSGDGAVYVWETAAGKSPRRWETKADVVPALTISADGKVTAFLVTKEIGSDSLRVGCAIGVWDWATGRESQQVCAWKDDMPWSAAISPDAKVLAINPAGKNELTVRNSGNRVCLRETASGREIGRIKTSEGGWRVAFSADGAAVFVGSRMWDVASGRQVSEFGGHLLDVSCLACSSGGRLIATGSEDTTILVRPTPSAAQEKSDPPREMQPLWADLASSDAARAWRAVHALVAAPEKSVPFLQTVLRPAPPVDQRRLARLLADLDSEQFPTRRQARAELSKLGELAEPMLRQTLEGKPSLEVRRQVLALLEQIEQEARSPEGLRVLRATAVLERIGTPESVELLRRLAGGAPEARLSREARGALKRLQRRIGR